MSALVENPEDRFSHDVAHLMINKDIFVSSLRTLLHVVVVVVNQFWNFIAAYELFVLFFSSLLNII